ncbi:MAG: ATP-dependent DNA helicase RecG [Acidobacteria bacterium]|nr:ATP-dependent DNA helicase RecG [Acidobacteriota bacterium]
MLNLTTPVQYVRGVGEQRARILENKGILTAEDLLYYIPFRYEDRTRVTGPDEVRAGEMATVIAHVVRCGMLNLRRGRVKIFRASVEGGGRRLWCKWFNAAYLQRIIEPGQILALYGKVEEDSYDGGLQMVQPQYEILPALPGSAPSAEDLLEIGRIVPIYETAGNGRLTSRFFRRVIHFVLESLAGIEDPLPPEVVAKYPVIPRWQAIRDIHFPPPGTRLGDLLRYRSPAHLRLIFEEFFLLEARLALRRKRAREVPGIAFQTDARVRESLKKVLPFHPTAAQKKAVAEIAADMRAPHPMQRLLQGEVGSGKTIVALQAALIAIENGCQVAMMVPTEVLATQHFLSFRRLLAQSGRNVILLSGSASAREKDGLKRLLKEGMVHLAVGTHALVEEDVEFKRLGLVIIDEQHRFGVMQRLRLMQKGSRPDTLVMTATPIPRTLALTMYGDLDISVITEVPHGRLPVLTRQVPEEAATKVYEFVRSQVNSGAQAFIIYPLVDEPVAPESEPRPEGSGLEKEARSQKSEVGRKKRGGTAAAQLKSAMKMYEHLSQNVFPELRLGLIHGRLPADEKDRTMQAFHSGEIQILVGTTVVEVGVDVPNATVMVIEQAERFGLTQLHQLRGRVGRGKKQSHCFLITSQKQTEAAQERLAALERTNDGFQIAEMDLRLRGPGEFLGTRQAGIPVLQVAHLLRDQEILEWARRIASEFMEHGDEREIARIVSYVKSAWEKRYGLVRSG